jgi:hypothetical protein
MDNMGVHNSIYLKAFLADPLQVTFAKLNSWFQAPPILTSIHQLQELAKRPSHQIDQLVSKIGHDQGNMLQIQTNPCIACSIQPFSKPLANHLGQDNSSKLKMQNVLCLAI